MLLSVEAVFGWNFVRGSFKMTASKLMTCRWFTFYTIDYKVFCFERSNHVHPDIGNADRCRHAIM